MFPNEGIMLMEFNRCGPDNMLELFDSLTGVYIDSANRMGIEHFFIDISHNSGGNDMFCLRLLRHLVTVPDTVLYQDFSTTLDGRLDTLEEQHVEMTILPKEPVFGGKVYVIQSQFSYSAAVTLANIVKQQGLGTILGEETGGLTTTYIRLKKRQLPNSRITFCCSDKYAHYAGTTGTRGVQPDVPLEIGYKYLFRSFEALELVELQN